VRWGWRYFGNILQLIGFEIIWATIRLESRSSLLVHFLSECVLLSQSWHWVGPRVVLANVGWATSFGCPPNGRRGWARKGPCPPYKKTLHPPPTPIGVGPRFHLLLFTFNPDRGWPQVSPSSLYISQKSLKAQKMVGFAIALPTLRKTILNHIFKYLCLTMRVSPLAGFPNGR